MATKTWIATTAANWNTAANWSPVGIPATTDDVIFNGSANGNCTLASLAGQCRSLVMTGYTGTFTMNIGLVVSGSDDGTVNGNTLVLGAGTTYSGSSGFTLTSSVGGKITFNSNTIYGLTLQNATGVWTTTDITRISASLTVSTTGGTINFPYDCYIGAIVVGSNTTVRSANFGTSGKINLYLTGVGILANISGSTNLSMLCNFDCYITDSSSSNKSLTYGTIFQNGNDVYLGGSGSGTITFAPGSIGGPSVYVTNTGGAAISFTSGAVSNITWQAGTNAVWTNQASQSLTIKGDLIMTSSMGNPTLTPGLTFGGNGTSQTSTITSGGKSLVTGAVTLDDSITQGSGAKNGTFNFTDAFSSNAALTITSCKTVNINADFTISSITATLTHTLGTLNVNNGANITCGLFSSTNSNTRTINMGSGTWNLTGIGAVWNMTTTTNATLNAQQSRILINNTTASAITFGGGGLTYYTLEHARGASTGTLTMAGSNTFVNFIDNTSTAAHTIGIASNAPSLSFYNFYVKGTPGNLITIGRLSAGSFTFNKLGRGIVTNCDYISIGTSLLTNAANTWYVGANSTSLSSPAFLATDAPSSQSLLGAGGVG